MLTLLSRLSLPANLTDFSKADNPTAKSPLRLTRFLTFLYLPTFNFQLLLYPSTLSFDWGMDAIPRLNSLCDSRNLISLIFYSVLAIAVTINLHRLYRRWQVVHAMANVHYRKPRTMKKRKAFQLPNCNIMVNSSSSSSNSGGIANSTSSPCNSINSNNNNNHSYNNNNQSSTCNLNATTTCYTINNNYLTKSYDCLCDVCKQGSNVRHSSSCRAINNNNVPLVQCECPTFRHSPSPPRKRRHHHNNNNSHHQNLFISSHLMQTVNVSNPNTYHMSSSATTTTTVDNTTIGPNRNLYKNSFVKNVPTTATTAAITNGKLTTNGKNISIQPSKIVNSVASAPITVTSNEPNTNHLHISHPSTTTSAVIVLSIALLTLPFVPAANLFYYVGFVVAERILYLPSVGYCLLIGLGVSKLMDSSRGMLRNQRWRYALKFCIGLTITVYSIKTIDRNTDWRNEESLFRSAITINPPKGKKEKKIIIIRNVYMY